MKPTPVLELATTKRLRSAPRSTATKRKVLMDDPMVLHGEYVFYLCFFLFFFYLSFYYIAPCVPFIKVLDLATICFALGCKTIKVISKLV